ncbi:phosphotransferase family protein [Photorhabdus laumondii]
MARMTTFRKKFVNKDRFNRELWAYKHLSYGFNSPQLVRFIDGPVSKELVLTAIDGHSINKIWNDTSEYEKTSLLESCAKLLYAFHCEFLEEGCDKRKIRSDVPYCLNMETWKFTLINRLRNWLLDLPLDSYLYKRLYYNIVDGISMVCDDGYINVIHADFLLQNVILSKGMLYLVDFESIYVGDVDYDIAKFLLVEIGIESKKAEIFIRSYEKAANRTLSKRKLQLYAAIHAIAALSWIKNNGCKSEAYRVSTSNYLSKYIESR